MNRWKDKYGLLSILPLCSVAILLIFYTCAFGAEEITPGRRLWNNIMVVVNFGIIVFLFLKYARKPLVDFLKGVIKKIEDQLNTVSRGVDSARSLKEEEESRLVEIENRIKEIQNSIIEMGKIERDRAIEQGRVAADKMIEDAKEYAGYRMDKAKKEFSDEMVDLAIDLDT